jgi:hypothetical protein
MIGVTTGRLQIDIKVKADLYRVTLRFSHRLYFLGGNNVSAESEDHLSSRNPFACENTFPELTLPYMNSNAHC